MAQASFHPQNNVLHGQALVTKTRENDERRRREHHDTQRMLEVGRTVTLTLLAEFLNVRSIRRIPPFLLSNLCVFGDFNVHVAA